VELNRQEEKYLKYAFKKGPDYVYPYFWSEIHTNQYGALKSLVAKGFIDFNADIEEACLKTGKKTGFLKVTDLDVRFILTDQGRGYLEFMAARNGGWPLFLKRLGLALAISGFLAWLIWGAK
jgi:hypothetical protein